MFYALTILAVMLVALTMALSLAHALEYPGKMRLTKEHYLAVQPIYYPGFTFAGIGEPLAIAATFAAAILTPRESAAFWPWWIAFAATLLAHGTYWLVTHPVNNFWLRDVKLGGAGTGFFGFGFLGGKIDRSDWTALRDRWEFSHIARAAFAGAGLLAAVIAVSI
jgi:hypothetical protein